MLFFFFFFRLRLLSAVFYARVAFPLFIFFSDERDVAADYAICFHVFAFDYSTGISAASLLLMLLSASIIQTY